MLVLKRFVKQMSCDEKLLRGSMFAAYGCSWQQLREAGTRLNGDKMPQYVVYFMHRIKMLQYNTMTPVVVFDGGRLPLKALTEEHRRK